MIEQRWYIEDQQVIDILLKNGFTCQHPETHVTPGAIHFYTRPKDEDKNWYVTSCCIPWNGQYTLADGNTLKSRGTSLLLVHETN